MRRVLLFVSFVVGCARTEPGPVPPRDPAPRTEEAPPFPVAASPSTHAVPPASSAPPAATLPPVRAKYPWGPSPTAERLDARFAPPAGFTRVPVAEASFGEFLRTLPLAPVGTKVVTFEGKPLYPHGEHPRIAAVVDIDVGDKDLQQCADAILRMHGEWQYGLGKKPTYRALAGVAMPYAEWVRGSRAVAEGNKLSWAPIATPQADDHALFRKYLDVVFTWANTTSIERDSKAVPIAELAAGDFFVLTGSPVGHGVLVLDVAKNDAGELALLLGQSYMPAQSFHVLKSATDATWFRVTKETTHVETPFWKPFPLSSLHRLP